MTAQQLREVRWRAMLGQREPNLASFLFDYETVTDLELKYLPLTYPWGKRRG